MKHRVLYLVRHAQESINKYGNRITNFETKTETEEFHNLKEARKRFSELKQTWENGNTDPLILKIRLQIQAISIVGAFWKDLLISDYNEYKMINQD